MSDAQLRARAREAAIGGFEEREALARATCRQEGHTWERITKPDPATTGRIIAIQWCWRCLGSAAYEEPDGSEGLCFTGKQGYTTALSTSGRSHIIRHLPLWNPQEDAIEQLSYNVWDPHVHGVVAICGAHLSLPPLDMPLDEAVGAGSVPVGCKHCLKRAKKFETDADIRQQGVTQTVKTRYLLMYGAGMDHPDVSKCGLCSHPLHIVEACKHTQSCACPAAH